MNAWPGVLVEDATTQLEDRHRRRRQALAGPDRATLCDRCSKPLGEGIYRLQHGHLLGQLATWFVCEECDHALARWMAEPRRPQP